MRSDPGDGSEGVIHGAGSLTCLAVCGVIQVMDLRGLFTVLDLLPVWLCLPFETSSLAPLLKHTLGK